MLVAAFFRIVPVVSTSLIGILGAIYVYQTQNTLNAIAVLIAYWYVDSRLTTDIYDREIKNANPFWMAMSVFMGYYAFDLQGIFYGPLLVCMIRIIIDIFNESP